MQNITIKGNKKSEIYIAESIDNINKYLLNKNVIIITDEIVYKHYSGKFPKFPVIKIGIGEKVKNLEIIEDIILQLIDLQADRNVFLLGIGGGIVCDITGFVASIYMRGINFGFVSTSLLSQVDASVGGKNGVNFNSYKNIIGNFNQPDFVICDIEMLKTLPQKEIKNGLGEIIKHSIISDKEMFNLLENNIDKILELDNSLITKLVYDSVKIKSEIVNIDEKEQNERKKLNLGHTFAHAIETHSNLSHGEAVCAGIVFSANFSLEKGFIKKNEADKIINLVKKYNLPDYTNINRQNLAEAIVKDKKKNKENIDFVFIKQIGEVVVKSVSINELQEYVLKY